MKNRKHPNGYFHSKKEPDFIGLSNSSSIGNNKKHFLELFAKFAKFNKGKILEIRASGEVDSNHDTIKNNFINFEYTHTDVIKNPNIDTVLWDFESKSPFEKNYFEIIYSNQSLEHTRKPWIVCEEITRIAKPNGLVYIRVPWSWRYHPAPIDYWRFSPECLIDMLSGLQVIECNFDKFYRRNNMKGKWPNQKDYVPIDDFGGWIENWQVYYLGTKKNKIL
jgi:SAM-dependent methyltransferase